MSRVSSAALTAAAALAATAAAAQTSGRPIDPTSIVYIECEGKNDEDQPIRTRGSGVVVTDDGQVLTAKHVVPAKEATCRGARGALAKMPVHFMVERRRSRDFDATLLQFVEDVSEEGSYAPVRYRDINSGMSGETVSTFGFPLGTFGNATRRDGIISATFPDTQGLIDVDARTTRGMSGGPVVLETGELIGIVAGSDFDPRTAEVTRYAVLVAEIIAGDFSGALEAATPTNAPVAASRTSDAGTGVTAIDQSLPPEIRDLASEAQAPNEANARLAPAGTSRPQLPTPAADPSATPPFPAPDADSPERANGTPSGDPADYPYRAVASIFFTRDVAGEENDHRFVCTGFLVAESFAITARHCLFEGPQADAPHIENIIVVPGYDEGLAPFGNCRATKVFATAPDNNSMDYGLAGVALDCNVGQRTGFLGLAEPTAGASASSGATLLGYAREELIELPLTRAPDSAARPMEGLVAYEGLSVSLGGSSGAPIIEGFQPGSAVEQNTVAVMMASSRAEGGPKRYFGTPLTPERLATIDSWIREAQVARAN